MFGILDSLIMFGGRTYRRVHGIDDFPTAPNYYFNRNTPLNGANLALLPVSTYKTPLVNRGFVDDKTALAFVLPRLPIFPEPKVMGDFVKEHSKILLDEIYSQNHRDLEIRCHSFPSMMGLWLVNQDSKKERRIKKLTLVSSAKDMSNVSWNSSSTKDIFEEARRRGYSLKDYQRELKEFDFENYSYGLKCCEIEIHHGTSDRMVNFNFGMDLADSLRKIGNNPKVVIYPYHDHTSTLIAYSLRKR